MDLRIMFGYARRAFGIAIDLVSSDPQPVKAIPVDVTLPRQKFINRDVVELADIFDREPTAAHRFNNGRLATHCPPLMGCWQLGHLAPNLHPIVVRGRFARAVGVQVLSPYLVSKEPAP